MAEILREGALFHLRNERISYIMGVMPENALAHLYFGPRLRKMDPDPVLRAQGSGDTSNFRLQDCGLDRLPQEYPVWGLGDQRDGALGITGPDGAWTAALRFDGSQIMDAPESRSVLHRF